MSLGGSPDRRKGGRCGPHPETAALIATRIVTDAPRRRVHPQGRPSPVDRLERRGSNEEPEGPLKRRDGVTAVAERVQCPRDRGAPTSWLDLET